MVREESEMWGEREENSSSFEVVLVVGSSLCTVKETTINLANRSVLCKQLNYFIFTLGESKNRLV